jgi:hypothetical protein
VSTTCRCLGLAPFLAMSLALAPPSSSYQNTSSSNADSETVSLKGTVVDSATGEPIHGALVQMSGAQSRAMLTGPDGKFDFEGLPPGHVVVHPRKPGYFSAYDLSPERQHLENIDVEPSNPPVVLKLIPEGVISGRVTAENGEPVEDLPVNVIFINIVNGRKQTEQRASMRTSEDGGFRIAELQPGTYYVSAGPSEPMTFPSPGVQGKGPQGYPLTFYPEARDIESAAPISIKAGTHAELDFSPPVQPLYQVSGTIIGIDPQYGVTVEFASASGPQNFLSVEFNPQTSVFTARAVPAGEYVINVGCQTAKQGLLAGSAVVNVNSNISNIRIVAAPTFSIPVLFTFDLANSSEVRNPVAASVHLIPPGPAPMNRNYWGNSRGNVGYWLRDLEPSSYTAVIEPQGPWYVASAGYGSTDLFRNPLVIAPGSTTGRIEIEVRDDGATLNGTVNDAGRPVPGAVLVIPDGAPGQPQRVLADERGNFQINMLAPGNYNVLAFDRLDDFEYTNPQALQPYATREKAITLGSNGKLTIQLDLIRRGE